MCLWQALSSSRSIKGLCHKGDTCPTEQRRAPELPCNGNIHLTIHPVTIFSHSRTQKTFEEWCGILLECHTSSGIWHIQIIGMWGHNTEVLQHDKTKNNPCWCIWQGISNYTHPGWWCSCLHFQSTHTQGAAPCKQWKGTTHLCLQYKMFLDICFGRHFTSESDYKPLEQISMKNLADAPGCL